MVIKIDCAKCCWKDGKCAGCSCGSTCIGCVEACPVGALERKSKVIADMEKCIGCGACAEACKHHAISLS